MFKVGKPKTNKRHIFDVITIAGIIFGAIALIALIFYQVVPIKLADIKVPIATDKASYYPSQEISGIFFGETFYDGEVRILREVFCSNYQGVIVPPEGQRVNPNLFSTQSKPRKLDGATIRVGVLPADVPIGANCVIRFTNIYSIKTPFGERREEYQYYTQNFSITSREQVDTNDATDVDNQQIQNDLNDSNDASSNSGGGTTNNTTTNNTTNNTTVPPSEPVTPPETCTINLLGIKAFCQ